MGGQKGTDARMERKRRSNNMKKILSLALALATTLTLTACSSSSDSSTSNTATATAATSGTTGEQKVWRVGTEGTYAPYSYHDENGNLTGFEIDVARAISEKMGYQVEFVESNWDSLFEGLAAGQFDAVMNQVTITPERQEKYAFSTPYVYTAPALIVAADNDEIKTFADVAGHKAAEGLTSNYNQIAQSYGAEIVGQDVVALAFQCVIDGTADLVINDRLTYAYWTSQTGDTTSLKIADTLDDVSSSAVVMLPDRNDDLLEQVNAAIEELLADGTIAQISQTYFNTDVSTVG
jgi:cystine transport system substrate-binding protein